MAFHTKYVPDAYITKSFSCCSLLAHLLACIILVACSLKPQLFSNVKNKTQQDDPLYIGVSWSVLPSVHKAAPQRVKKILNRRIQFNSSKVSERTNRRIQARERSEQCRASELVSGASDRAHGDANGPVNYQNQYVKKSVQSRLTGFNLLVQHFTNMDKEFCLILSIFQKFLVLLFSCFKFVHFDFFFLRKKKENIWSVHCIEFLKKWFFLEFFLI